MDPKKLKEHVEWIQHSDLKDFLSSVEAPRPWFPAYRYDNAGHGSVGWFSALLPPSRIPELVKNDSWDFHAEGLGHPSIWTHFDRGQVSRRVYCSFGNEEGIEPLVIRRNFHGLRPGSSEVAQEFRLYHNLFHDLPHRRYVHFDDDGNESDAVKYDDNAVEIRTDLLLAFCAAKQMALALYVDSRRCSRLTLGQLGLQEIRHQDSGSSHGYLVSVIPDRNHVEKEFETFSRLVGKKFIMPGPMPPERTGRDEAYQEFIIGTDATGKPVKSTCDPEQLDNNFGRSPGSAHYLTPVFFRADVLSKYYANPQKYSVEDGYLRCRGLWSIQIDNDQADYVVVFLGDLGRDLSEKERSYWLSFNVPPDGRKISETNFRRSFLAEFTDPARPDLAFKHEYARFQEDFQKAHGWHFFRPLHADDAHFLIALRLPSKDSQSEFDSQLLALTKIVVDSINEEKIAEGVSTLVENDKCITKLEKFFVENGLSDYGPRIRYLRGLQDLRSKSAAHRKGSNYEKLVKDLQLADEGHQRVFEALLYAAIDLISYLRANLLPTQQAASNG